MSDSTRLFPSTWKPFNFILTLSLITLSVITLLCPSTHFIWKHLDMWFFKVANGHLCIGKPVKLFWAFANHKYADWVEDVVILYCCCYYILKGDKETRLHRSAQILFVVFFASSIILFNKLFLSEGVFHSRLSPSIIFDSCIRLSQELPWLKIKDFSPYSFPSDHGVTAILVGLHIGYLLKGKMKTFIYFYSTFLCLPRMVVGAHWLTDTLVGSFSISLFFFSWILFTPFGNACSCFIEFLFKKISVIKRKDSRHLIKSTK